MRWLRRVPLAARSVSGVGWRTAWLAVILLGLALRLQRIAWQPLWWDEGYSIFFATEPLPEMLRLTAQDIHPPLYYALLHLWFNLLGDSGPVTARTFSVLVGAATLPAIAWACLTLLPRRRWLALLATVLLAISPIHIYYSQEVRMYGLAVLLTLIASTLLWRIQQQLEQGRRPLAATAGYVVAASLALLTLYYTAFVLVAHQLWVLSANRGRWRRVLWFWSAALLIVLIQLPWWFYALPKLVIYIGNKVQSDQDTALPLWTYLWRHWLAFTIGHVTPRQSWLQMARWIVAALIALTTVIGLFLAQGKTLRRVRSWLLSHLGIPIAIGFAVNLAYPFMPVGGERLLLPVVPYLVILWAVLMNSAAAHKLLPTILALLLLTGSTIGTAILFTTPRYTEHDYRPIIADIMQQSRANDTVLALFPWQVGYWRAYSPHTAEGKLLPPQPAPVDQSILTWNDSFAARLDAALAQGTIWFPMPLSFGSSLPEQIETFLAKRAANLENHWYSPATRLSAWVTARSAQERHAFGLTYPGGLQLVSASVAPTRVGSDNTPIAVDLCWQPATARPDLRATLRLVDGNGTTWASRDLTPLAALAGNLGDEPCREAVAFSVPVGLPPDTYQLQIGVGPSASDQLFIPTGASSPLVTIGELQISPPSAALSPERLPIQHRLAAPLTDTGLLLLGSSGPDAATPQLAGDSLHAILFLQNTVPHAPARDLYISLLDRSGNGVAGGQLWPIPDYPTNVWAEGALAQVPVEFFLPADLPAGRYTLVAGFVDPQSSEKSPYAALTPIQIVRRAAVMTPPLTAFTIQPVPTLGTHAMLTGYDYKLDGSTLQLDLTWHVIQPLLPPHHIFVHLTGASGAAIAQADGEPQTAQGRAPTGSWLPGEYVTTRHVLHLADDGDTPFTAQVGLYLPATGTRLPVTVAGSTVGDSVTITLAAKP